MVIEVWKAAADKVATYIREHQYSFHRGLLLVPRSQEGIVIGWIFGNDNYAQDDQARREVDEIRRRLKENAVQELAFGLSQDGHAWVLVLRADAHGYQTQVGKAFHLEMVRELLDEALQGPGQVSFEVQGRQWTGVSEHRQPVR